MKILYDHQIFTMQRWGGISRYYSELIKELKESAFFEVQTAIKLSNNKYLSKFDNHNHYSFFPGKRFLGKDRLQGIINLYNSKKCIKNCGFDIFHPTYYDPYFITDVGHKPVVVTVYDMIHEKFPSFFPKNDKTSVNKERVVKRADQIIAISRQTRDDLLEIFGIDEKKVSVIYLGNSLEVENSSQKLNSHPLPREFILFVGVRKGYKNFQTLVNAISSILHDRKDLYLVCIGGGSFDKAEISFLREKSLYEKVMQLSCTDSDLTRIYRSASCLVIPSLYEGFGLPVIEAFSAGCPVVCSNRGSLPEIAGDAACFFDPLSENDIQKAVYKTLSDEAYRKKLIEKGSLRLNKFSWKETATQTKKVYESL